jgi:hypothetical protein
MILKTVLGPFERNPRILINTWCERINYAACGLAIQTGDEKQRRQPGQPRQAGNPKMRNR